MINPEKHSALVMTLDEVIAELRLNEKRSDGVERSYGAKKMACWRFRKANGIEAFPGGGFSRRAVENALNK